MMKVNLLDATVLRAIQPQQLLLYLYHQGATLKGRLGDKATLWTIEDRAQNSIDVVVPLRSTLSDYSARIAELLASLEKVTQRTQSHIYNEITQADSDLVRIRLASSEFEFGTIPFRQGREAVNHAYDLLLAAASSSIEQRAIFFSKKPDEALHYMDTVRMGQTEQGSYVLTFVSPVAADPNINLWSQTDLLNYIDINDSWTESTFSIQDPFERIVTKNLARALTVIDEPIRNQLSQLKQRASSDVLLGVSANLCDALIGLQGGDGESTLEVSFAWAQSREAPTQVRDSVKVDTNLVQLLKERSRILRQAVPDTIYIEGFVKKLSRNKLGPAPGKVTVRALYEHHFRDFEVSLSLDDYNKASKAHTEFQAVACSGNLKMRGGNVFVLEKPFDFRILRSEEYDASNLHAVRSVERQSDPLTLSMFGSEIDT